MVAHRHRLRNCGVLEGLLAFVWGAVEITEGSGLVEQEVILRRGGNLVIEVRDAAGRRFADPMPLLKITRLDGGPAVAPSRYFVDRDPRVLTLRSESPGTAHLEKLPPGAYQLTASKKGFRDATARVGVVPEKIGRLELLLSR